MATARLVVNESACTGCGACVESCPLDVLHMDGGVAKALYIEDCQMCFLCVFDCPVKCIRIEISRMPAPPVWVHERGG